MFKTFLKHKMLTLYWWTTRHTVFRDRRTICLEWERIPRVFCHWRAFDDEARLRLRQSLCPPHHFALKERDEIIIIKNMVKNLHNNYVFGVMAYFKNLIFGKVKVCNIHSGKITFLNVGYLINFMSRRRKIITSEFYGFYLTSLMFFKNYF